MKLLIIAIILSLGTGAPAFAQAKPTSPTTDEFDVIMSAAIAVNGQVPPGSDRVRAVDLKTALENGDPSDDSLIVDVRSYPEYSAGHIPGAINIHYRDLGKPSALSDLDSTLAAHVAAGKMDELVVYGNTHHLGLLVAAYLTATQGYPAMSLNDGFAEWTADEAAAPGRFKECTTFDSDGKGIYPAGCTSNDFPTTTADAIDAATQSGAGYPEIDCIPSPATSGDLAEIARCMYDARFGDPDKPGIRIASAALYDLLNDADPLNDPYILSNRGTFWDRPICTVPGAYYAYGHIPGAVGVDWCSGIDREELRTLDATDFIPMDALVVHHCWAGVSELYGALWYNLLGYSTVSLDYGMNGWTIDSTVRQVTISAAAWYPNDFAYDTTPTLSVPTTDKPTYLVGDLVQVSWSAIPAPTQPEYVMMEFYNETDAVTEELTALPPSATFYAGHLVVASESGDQITMFIYYADDASDKHGDPGTSDEVSTSIDVVLAGCFLSTVRIAGE